VSRMRICNVSAAAKGRTVARPQLSRAQLSLLQDIREALTHRQHRGIRRGKELSIDAGALHPRTSRLRYIAVLRFRLYLDESGSQTDGPVFVVAGWISSEKKWRQFERAWQRALDDAGMKEFHATDFFSRRGKYKDWSCEKHVQFSRRFTAIAETYTSAGVGRGVDLSAYRDLVLPEPLFRVGTPHERFASRLFCTRTCLEWIAEMMRPIIMPQGEQIAVIFEGGPGVGETIEWCEYLRRHFSWASLYSSFTSGPKVFLPLQAADLLAHETWRCIKEHLSPTGRPLRKSFQRLIKSKNVSINVGTRKRFIDGINLIKRFSDDPNG
jgi:hypothetical protein